MTTTAAPALTLRPIGADDTEVVAQIVFEAFAAIHDRHGFPRDFPTTDAARQLVTAFTAHPKIWGVVAEEDGRIVGSNFLDERGPVAGVGPITVDPAVDGRRIGRTLMQAVLEHGAGKEGIRLLQDSFNTKSLALYASLGFEPTEPVVVMGGRPVSTPASDGQVRPMTRADVSQCERLHLSVKGFERSVELLDALDAPHLQPYVAVRDSRVVAYVTTVSFFPAAYGVAENEQDMAALVLGALAQTDADASFLLPVRQHDLFRACLAAGLRVVKPMTYMVVGGHRETRGAWIPSVLY